MTQRIIVRGLNADLAIGRAEDAAETAEAAAASAAADVATALAGYVTAAQTAEAAAEAARDETVAISGISTSDEVVEALVRGTAGAGPLTRDALSDTFAPVSSTWATGRVYVLGELVVHSGRAYEVSTAHTAGGAFDASKFTEVGGASLTVQDENGNVGTSVTRIDFQGAGVVATAGTGEVVVTIAGSPITNVKDYGALGDGTTNDTAAIQAAIDALATAGGGLLYFPTGTYMVTTLNIKTRVILQGTGFGSIIKQIASTSAHLIKTPDGFQYLFGVRDLALHGNKANQTVANNGLHFYGDASMGGGYGTPAVTDMRLIVQNVHIQNVKGHGVYIGTTARESVLAAVYVIATDGHGFYLDSGATDCVLHSCVAGVIGKTGFYLDGAINTRAVDCKAFMTGEIDSVTAGDGFRIKGDDSSFSSCMTQQTKRSAFRLDATHYCSLQACNAGDSRATAFNLVGVCKSNMVDGVVQPAQTINLCPAAFQINSALTVNNRVRLTVEAAYTTVMVEQSFGIGISNDVQINGMGGTQVPTFVTPYTPDPYLGTSIQMTLTGNIAVSKPAQRQNNQRLRFVFTQDATGGRTCTFAAEFKVPATFVPDTTAGKINVIEFACSGTGTAAVWLPVSWATGL